MLKYAGSCNAYSSNGIRICLNLFKQKKKKSTHSILYAQTSKQKRVIIVVNTYKSYHFQNSVHTQVDDPMPEPKVAWESRTNC